MSRKAIAIQASIVGALFLLVSSPIIVDMFCSGDSEGSLRARYMMGVAHVVMRFDRNGKYYDFYEKAHRNRFDLRKAKGIPFDNSSQRDALFRCAAEIEPDIHVWGWYYTGSHPHTGGSGELFFYIPPKRLDSFEEKITAARAALSP